MTFNNFKMVWFCRASSLAIALTLFCAISRVALAAYATTGFVSNLDIYMDNGVVYFGGVTLTGSCLYSRLELRDTGDYMGSVENGKRMYALILSARMSGKRIKLGFNDTDGPACRVAEVWIEW